MTYSDLHRPVAADSSPAAGRTDVLRIVLWVVLAVSAIGNTVASITDAGTVPHLVFGALSAVSAIILGVRFLRARR
ncbi:hypothetical protein ACFLIM_05630 [Nonomuraea sp. M3C6]|uniref:PEP-CTERM protein-sorting domain-containing protein n=1 Tax=Nonomuraea marmarensis TaxID=3351344 RepID=A0ABW7A7Z1_9ACTN